MGMAGIRRRKTAWLYFETPLLVATLAALVNIISGGALAIPGTNIATAITTANLQAIFVGVFTTALIVTFFLVYFLAWLTDKFMRQYLHRAANGVKNNIFLSAGVTLGILGFVGLVAANAASLPTFIFFVAVAALFGAGGQYIGEAL